MGEWADYWYGDESCESQGCVCSPSNPCDESLCDGQQESDGSTTTCTMCRKDLADMMAAG